MTIAEELLSSLKMLKSEKKLILIITTIVLFWGSLYAFTLYHPKYRSEARIWIKNVDPETQIDPVSSYNDSQNPLSPVAQAGNPILTQMEILKSNRIAQDLTNFINRRYPQENPTGELIQLKKKLKLKNKIGTDIIEVSFTWSDPKLSQLFLKRVLNQYEHIVYDTNNVVKRKKREFIDKKIAEIEKNLTDVNERIKHYKENNNVITLQSESDQLTSRKSDIESTLAKVKMQKEGALNRVNDLKSRLGINSAKTLSSSMITYDNKAYLQLQEALNIAKMDYLDKRSILADENPKLIALKEKVDYLEQKLQELNGSSTGKGGNALSINDPVKAHVAEDLAASQSSYMDLAAQEQALKATLDGLNHEYNDMAAKEFTLTELQSMQDVLLTAYRSLKTQQIEAHMSEAQNISNIFDIDKPSLPLKQAPITQVQYIFLSLAAGLILGIFVAIVKQKLQQLTLPKDIILSVTRKPILGRIPWFSRYADFLGKQESLEHAYKGIVTGLKLQSEKENDRVIAFTSPEAESPRKFAMVYEIAKTMASLNYRVALVDCHLKQPIFLSQVTQEDSILQSPDRLHKAHSEEKSSEGGSISTLTRRYERETLSSVGIDDRIPIFEELLPSSEDSPVLYGVKFPVEDPYELFSSSRFGRFIDVLKQDYDWIFIDSPFGRQAPEFPLIAKEADGVVLLLKYQLTESELKEATSLLAEWDIKLLGTVIREYNPQFNPDLK